MPDVFLSYKRERRPAAEHLARILTLHGYDTWFDYNLVKGHDFALQIDRMIRSSKVLVVLWCTRSVGSRWVQEEVDLAQELGVLLPVRIERCEMPVGNRRLDSLDLAAWDGSPRSSALDDVLIAIGERVGKPPVPEFVGLREHEALWRRFGSPRLSAFGLDETQDQVQGPTEHQDLLVTDQARSTFATDMSVFREIWADLRMTDSTDRLRRFLEQVRNTPLELAVEERIAHLEQLVVSTPTATWLRESRPWLERIKSLYQSMGWKQGGPKPDAGRFHASLRVLIEALPPVPEGSDIVTVANTLDEYLSVKLHHGLPIPDDYTLRCVFPLPGSQWGDDARKVAMCFRPGVHSTYYHREGFGELDDGLIVAPEIVFKD